MSVLRGLFEDDGGVGFGGGVVDGVAGGPLVIFEEFGFSVHGAVGVDGGGAAHFGDAVGVAGDFFDGGPGVVFDFEGALGEEAGGGEVPEGDFFLLGVPHDDSFAAVDSLVEGVEAADGLAVHGAFPAGGVDHGFFGCGVGEGAFPGFSEERGEDFEVIVEGGGVFGAGGGGEGEEEQECDGEKAHEVAP